MRDCRHPSREVCGPTGGAGAAADLWGGLRQAHQSLPLWGASDGSQLQAVGLQLGDGGEEGRCWQGGSREVRGATAFLFVPAEVEGHLLPYRRCPRAPLMLHCCRAPRRSEGVTAGSRTRYPMVLGWASLPPCNFSGPAPCPMPKGCVARNR